MDNLYSAPFITSTREMLETMVGISCGVGEGAGLVSQMKGLVAEDVDDETLKDGVGEMANIVAGNVKAALTDSRFDLKLTLPTVHVGPVEAPFTSVRSRRMTDCGEVDLLFWPEGGEG